MANKIYCISDLHGHFDIFETMLEALQFDDSDTMYVIGDVFDRGPEGFRIYCYIKEHDNIILLKGNHELLAQQAFRACMIYSNLDAQCEATDVWLLNGGGKTIDEIREYLGKDKIPYSEYVYKRFQLAEEMYYELKSLPLYKELYIEGRHYVLVHAGIEEGIPLEQQDEMTMLWTREKFLNSQCDLNTFYIFGHTPTIMIHGTNDVWMDPNYRNKIDIDGGLANHGNSGQLNCICLNDHRIYAIKQVDIL